MCSDARRRARGTPGASPGGRAAAILVPVYVSNHGFLDPHWSDSDNSFCYELRFLRCPPKPQPSTRENSGAGATRPSSTPGMHR